MAADRPPPPTLSDNTAFPPEVAANKPPAVQGKLAPLSKKASSSTVSQSYACRDSRLHTHGLSHCSVHHCTILRSPSGISHARCRSGSSAACPLHPFVPGAICFDWTASFGVLCLGVLTCGQLHLSHPRLSLRTSLGDRAVSPGTPGPIGTHVVRDRRVSPNPVSRSAATCDEVGEQARSVNLSGIRSRGGVHGVTRWLTVKIHRGYSQAHGGQDRRFLPNSVRVLSQDRCIPLGMHGIANDLRPSGRVGSMYSLATVRTRKVRAVLRWD